MSTPTTCPGCGRLLPADGGPCPSCTLPSPGVGAPAAEAGTGMVAGRGFTLDAASHRVIVVRLTEADLADGVHHRLAPALLLALWSTPAQARDEA